MLLGYAIRTGYVIDRLSGLDKSTQRPTKLTVCSALVEQYIQRALALQRALSTAALTLAKHLMIFTENSAILHQLGAHTCRKLWQHC